MTGAATAILEAPESLISDGLGHFTLAGLSAAACSWEAWFERNGISRQDCVALSVKNEARSAAALLALLARGQSMLLWRQPLAIEGERIATGSLPPFCRFAMLDTTEAGPSGDSADAARPVTDPEAFRLLPAQNLARRAGGCSPYVYVATSGTTGKPKIAAFTHDALRGNAANCRQRLRIGSGDRVIIPVPLAHMYGLGAGFLPAVQAGAAIRLVPDANLVRYIEAETGFDPTAAFLTPSFCHLLLKGRKRPRPYRLTVMAGDRVSERTFTDNESRHGCTVVLYGSTELGVIAAGNPSDDFTQRRDTVGTPLAGVELAIPSQREAPGQGATAVFALRVRHPYGCAGYADEHGVPVMPTSLCEDGWYATQDLGSLDAEGRIGLSGRCDHTVKRDGMLVAFADVEHALQKIESIERVIVVAGTDTPRGRELVAICTVIAGAPREAIAITRAARGWLPGHAVPDRFIFVDELPLTATAKPDRIALAAMAISPREDVTDARSA